ncbi:transferase [Hahella sp. KA22]|uniref:carbamoyltransferase family protein n=1 Tax=Hahella sp. KA22 TaxID=1628392 RepID=UPI000FDEDB12|nr:carbamoyltransferase C-terminal domain-containing protein [Hahella sp. KA22]AZZ92930.1 transferase [Hahella sp. KA22]QAY56304.1 transferase [Hahella sp. KA22]
MSKPIYVLGTGLSHDGSACLLKDGEVCVAIEKERITRIKHDGFCDSEAMQYCLDAEGISFDDVSAVVQNANFSNFDRGNKIFHGQPRIIPDHVKTVTISHHLAHAYSVVGTSPFDDMAVLVIDGCGSSWDDCLDLDGAHVPEAQPGADFNHLFFEKDSYYLYEKGKLRPVYKDFSPFGYFLKGYSMCPPTTKHSIGGLYSGVSQYVFQGMEDPGKLMGLAPYGRPGVYDFQAFECRDGRVFVNYDWMKHFNRPRVRYEDLAENFDYYADIAYWMQREIERALLYLVNHRFEHQPHKNLGYAGGVALNAVANAKLLKQTGFEDFYFQPAAADNGLAIGCAYYGWLEVLGQERIKHDASPYFGKSYEAEELYPAMQTYAGKISYRRLPEDEAINRTAELLAEGKVVAWFEKGSEFGPRALGHRSILADPRNPDVREHINRNVKFREDFRPFAPSVPLEKAGVYFDCDYPSPYMILVAPTREEWKKEIPAVVHADGSARVQTVTESVSPNYYRLLNKFGELTGVYVLLNTSFNKKGMPIVETPKEALDFFMECALDALVIDGCLIEKAAVAQAPRKVDEKKEWEKGLGSLYPENVGI